MKKIIAITLIFLSLLVVLGTLLSDAAHRPCFIDELLSVESSSAVWWKGRYELSDVVPTVRTDGTRLGEWFKYANIQFTAGQSIGWAANWVSGIAWNFRGTLWSARTASILHHGLLFALLGVVIHRRTREKYKLAFTEIAASLAWFWMLTLLTVSYSQDSINHSLGETPSALWMLIGALVGQTSPFWGAAAVGLAIWHGKFIFLPIGVVLAFSMMLADGISDRRQLFRRFLLVKAGAAFPFLLWLLWITVASGPEVALHWVQGRLAFLKYGNSGFDRKIEVVHGLWNRLQSSQLEWVTYEGKVKLRILILLFVAPLALGVQFFWGRVRDLGTVSRSLGVAACSLIYAYWYFFIHPSMWLRHLQPALFLGWGVIASFIWLAWARRPVQQRLVILGTATCLLFVWQIRKPDTREGLQYLFHAPQGTYVAGCARSVEDPYLPPKSTPGCACGGDLWPRLK